MASTLAANAKMGLAVGVRLVVWFPAILVRGTIYKPVRVHLWPHTIVRLWYKMVQLILMKVTMHPALNIVKMERRECECDTRPGMMWAAWAVGGRSGRLRVHI